MGLPHSGVLTPALRELSGRVSAGFKPTLRPRRRTCRWTNPPPLAPRPDHTVALPRVRPHQRFNAIRTRVMRHDPLIGCPDGLSYVGHSTARPSAIERTREGSPTTRVYPPMTQPVERTAGRLPARLADVHVSDLGVACESQGLDARRPSMSRRSYADPDWSPRCEGPGSLAGVAEARGVLRASRCHQHPHVR